MPPCAWRAERLKLSFGSLTFRLQPAESRGCNDVVKATARGRSVVEVRTHGRSCQNRAVRSEEKLRIDSPGAPGRPTAQNAGPG